MLGWASQPELDVVLSVEWPFEWCERWLVCGYRKKVSFLQCRDANRAPIGHADVHGSVQWFQWELGAELARLGQVEDGGGREAVLTA